jgi:Uma2 family endonuclease
MSTTAKREDLEIPPRRRWTVEEFQNASDAGLFGPQERLELVEGEIFEKMTQNSLHSTGIRNCEEEMRHVFADGFDVRVQMPITLSNTSRPDPDVAVVTGSRFDYEEAHPTTAVLVIEVSDSTLAFDRTQKATMYACAGIPEYWVLNLNDRQLEVYRQPAPLASQAETHQYLILLHLADTEMVSPLANPQSSVCVADLLPRRRQVASDG